MKQLKEEWRVIKDHPQYEVSNLGNIRHVVRKQNRIPQDNGNGYKYVGIKESGKAVNIYIHRAVAEAFIPNPNNLPQVSHLDESRDNNNVNNLCWATEKENCNMPLHFKRMSIAKGKPCICIETGVVYHSAAEAGRQTGISAQVIAKCCRKEKSYKTAGGYHWRYAE